MSYKKDNKLGSEVSKYLIQKGIETPMLKPFNQSNESLQVISTAFGLIMEELGLNLNDDSLKDTPMRVSKMFCNEMFSGLNYENFPGATTVENKMNYDEMVLVKDIQIHSTCEHHFVLIDGKAHIAYMPKDKIIGLSKLNRIAKFFSKRPQIQERLTEQIFYALEYILETEDIAVVIDAAHYCVKCRGVEDVNSSTITSKVGGKFKENQSLRAEYLRLIK